MANSCATLIQHSVNALKLFINSDDEEKLNTLVNDICELWPIIKDIPQLETSDIGQIQICLSDHVETEMCREIGYPTISLTEVFTVLHVWGSQIHLMLG